MDEIARMYGSEHGADRIFFRIRPDDGSVVTEDDSVGWDVRRV
jgi:hypothetical protein